MKKFMFILAAVALMATFTGCKKDDDKQMVVTISDIPSEYHGKPGILAFSTGSSSSAPNVAWAMATVSTGGTLICRMLDWDKDKPWGKDGNYFVVLDISESTASGAPSLYQGFVLSIRMAGEAVPLSFNEFTEIAK